jgi:hypothetical protein
LYSHPDKCVVTLSAKVVANTTIKCWYHIEFVYFSKTTGKSFPLVCAWCAGSLSSECLAEREDSLTEIATCLPLCSDMPRRKKGCVSRGKRKAGRKQQISQKKIVKTKISAQKSVGSKQKVSTSKSAGSGAKLSKSAKVANAGK